MKVTERRIFLLHAAACATALATGASAQGLPKLEEADPQAIALGYKHDTTKVDPKKYPKHAVAQKCSNCPLFQGKAGDAWGPCPLFAGKQVTAAGWCSAWTGKAA